MTRALRNSFRKRYLQALRERNTRRMGYIRAYLRLVLNG